MSFWQDKNVVVTGGAGFLGSYLCRLLRQQGCEPFIVRSSEYDLRQSEARQLFCDIGQVDALFHLAANVGGIGYNQAHPYRLFFDNALMGLNIINLAIEAGVKKFVGVGTVCAYPKFAPAPFSEESLWDGYPEETNAPYGLAKKILLVQLQAARAEYDFNGIFLLPTNLYGPGDEFRPYRSHVIPALIRKCFEAKETGGTIEVWGTGRAGRDFVYVEDAAEAILLAAEKYDRSEPLNIGSGTEVNIAALVHHIKRLTGCEAPIKWDISRPDGQPRRRLNIRRIKDALGWMPKTSLVDGLAKTIEWYKKRTEELCLNYPSLPPPLLTARTD
ncbi:MAG: NAD-dependent epimerase/dehydratase family protein [Nitrospiria bacterium]